MTRATEAARDAVAEIIDRKAQGRVALAALSFGEKIARMEALRERLHPLRALRQPSERPGGRAASHADG